MEVRKFYQPAKLPTEMRIMEVEVMGRENGSYYACLQFQRYLLLYIINNKILTNMGHKYFLTL